MMFAATDTTISASLLEISI